MDEKSYTIRVSKRWARTALVVLVTAAIVAPLTAVASHNFTDVPDSNIFHGDIEWMADAGVTKGCNPPANTLFCPKDEVTRETLSAFMHRLAVNQVVDAATAVTSEQIEGRAHGCAPGQTEYSGECWETEPRASTTDVFAAADACGDEAGRLPAILELRRFRQISSVTSASNEWSSTVYYDGTFRGFRITGNGMIDSSTIDDGPYRCVFPILETTATPASNNLLGTPAEDGS